MSRKGHERKHFICVSVHCREGLRMSIENQEYKDSRSVSQHENLEYPRF